MNAVKTPAIILAASIIALGHASQGAAELTYGISGTGAGQAILSWDSATPETIIEAHYLERNQSPFTGVVLAIDSIDFHPNTGAVRIRGIANNFGALDLFPSGGVFQTIAARQNYDGVNFGLNITSGFRVASDTNKHYPDATDIFSQGPDLWFAPGDANAGVDPNIVHLASKNGVLYGIDAGLDVLTVIDPLTSVMTTVGPLGVQVAAAGGFDVSDRSGIAYAALLESNSSESTFWTIDLTTGAATKVGRIGSGFVVAAMTVPRVPAPEPGSMVLLLMAIVGLRRRYTSTRAPRLRVKRERKTDIASI